MPTQKKVAVLASGGLDSAILIDFFLQKGVVVQPLYVQSGHIWEKAELFWLGRFLKQIRNKNLKPLATLSLPTEDLYQNHWSLTGKKVPGVKSHDKQVYLPGKNLLLIGKASVFCALKKIHALALGSLKTNPFPDAKPVFFKAIGEVCSKALNSKLMILTPFIHHSKKQVMRLGRSLPLELTFSCLSPHPSLSLRERDRVRDYIHCGKCNKCAERKRAFQLARMMDRTRYAN